MKPPPQAANVSMVSVFPLSLDSLRSSDVTSRSNFKDKLVVAVATLLSLARNNLERHAMIESVGT